MLTDGANTYGYNAESEIKSAASVNYTGVYPERSRRNADFYPFAGDPKDVGTPAGIANLPFTLGEAADLTKDAAEALKNIIQLPPPPPLPPPASPTPQ